MHDNRFLTALLPVLLLVGGLSTVNAAPMTLIDGSTQGYYNDSLGTALDLTNPVGSTHLFPGADISTGDPSIDPVPFEPDLSAVSTELGNWLGDPANLNANWTLQSIPSTWAVNTETAIVYAIDAGVTGLANVIAEFGIDNGIFIWLDGNFISGELRPGGSTLGEHVANLGNLDPGTHYLQILREDHGGATGYAVNVTGEVAANVPEPGMLLLFGTGVVLMLVSGIRKRVG